MRPFLKRLAEQTREQAPKCWADPYCELQRKKVRSLPLPEAGVIFLTQGGLRPCVTVIDSLLKRTYEVIAAQTGHA